MTGNLLMERRRERVAALLPEAIRLRRLIHASPERGLALPNTQKFVVDYLSSLGIEYVVGKEIGSVTALIRGATEGPTLLLRADMDALPVVEETGYSFASETTGLMHACGHDIHTASLLAAAVILAEERFSLAGNIILMFQPGEEGYFGGRAMVEEGILEEPFPGVAPVSRAFALHVNPWYPTGTVNIRSGPILAAADQFRIRLSGRSGHGSAPHASLDPIPAACELVAAIQAHVARRVSAFEPTVVSVTSLTAGSIEAHSVIPRDAEIAGTIRTLSESGRADLHAALTQLAGGIAHAHGLAVETVIDRGYPVTVNDPAAATEITQALSEGFAQDAVLTLENALMGSEDFSYVLAQVPGALAFIGTTPEEKLRTGYPADNHSATVDYDENAIQAFILAHLAVAHGYLGEHANVD